MSSTVLSRVWARRPALAHAQIALHSRFYDSPILPGRLLELVRRIKRLSEHFSDEEVVEVGMFASLMVGSGRIAYALNAFGE